ncbi:hypothetical protein LC20_09010 [Yersinia hibernica]|uniref:Uncharacterized protein n=1 Tax=Yersinia enterocolitica LC20 TaxID=1443113 RepID=A0A7U5PH59_YEREN|nr:hypothetical protein LC20_09010 [Yersinia hibernica]
MESKAKAKMSLTSLIRYVFAVIGFLIVMGFVLSIPNGLNLGVIHFGYNQLFGLFFRIDITSYCFVCLL